MNIVVQRGDSLWKYSQLFDLPLQLLIDSNANIQTEALQIGQIIVVPGYWLDYYTVAAGDSLWLISNRTGTDVDQIIHLNTLHNPQNLSIGQTLLLPRRVTDLIITWSAPYSFETMQTDITKLLAIYPFIKQETIGNSVMGKPLYALTIGQGKKQIGMNGAIHANEWITTPNMMRFLNEYALAVTNGKAMRGLAMLPFYLQTSLALVPMANPDGVDLVIKGLPSTEPYHSDVLKINEGSTQFNGWKANIRGVDLNKQFPALWEQDAKKGPQQPAPRDYSGTAPLTEPEAKALANWTENNDFVHVLAFHTQGKVIYWGFEQLEPPQSEAIAAEFARVSGYVPIRSIDSTAGYKDWFIMKWRKPGFTIELGQGINPLPLSQIDEIYEAAAGIMLAALYE